MKIREWQRMTIIMKKVWIKGKISRFESIMEPIVRLVRSQSEFPSRRPSTCNSSRNRQIANGLEQPLRQAKEMALCQTRRRRMTKLRQMVNILGRQRTPEALSRLGSCRALSRRWRTPLSTRTSVRDLITWAGKTTAGLKYTVMSQTETTPVMLTNT